MQIAQERPVISTFNFRHGRRHQLTVVTQDRDRDGAELSASDEQLLRELTGQASDGELKLTSEGGLLGKLTKMAIRGEPATSNIQLQELTLTKKPGDTVSIGYSRDGRSATAAITLGAQP
jgi:hypothetical protein